jgi:uncharacterized protein (DUF4415 family)
MTKWPKREEIEKVLKMLDGNPELYTCKDVLSDENFNKNNIKEKAIIWIDENVLNAFKERANQNESDFQDLINQTLKDAIKNNPEKYKEQS